MTRKSPQLVGGLISLVIIAMILVIIYWQRSSPLAVFVSYIFLLFAVVQPVRFLLIAAMKEQVNRELEKDPFTGRRYRGWLPNWVGFRATIVIGVILFVLTITTTATQVERFMGGEYDAWWKASLLFLASFVLTWITAAVILLPLQFLAQTAFNFAARMHQDRLAFLLIRGLDPTEAYQYAAIATLVVVNLSFLLVPTFIIFSRENTPYLMFSLAVLVTTIPLIVLLVRRKTIPEAFFFELPRLFIPLQIVLGLLLIAIAIIAYAVLHYARFELGDRIGVTIPFNIPRVFDQVFQVEPFDPFFYTLSEAILAAVAVAILLTWLFATVLRRSWANLLHGFTAGAIVFAAPLIFTADFLNSFVIPNFEVVHPFILAVMIPLAFGSLITLIAEKALPRTKTCGRCLFGGMDVYSSYCPRCGSLHHDNAYTVEELEEMARTRKREILRHGFELAPEKIDKISEKLAEIPASSPDAINMAIETSTAYPIEQVVGILKNTSIEELLEHPALTRILVSRILEHLDQNH